MPEGIRSDRGKGERLEEFDGSANIVTAAFVAHRRLTHGVRKRFCELDVMVDSVHE